MKAVQYILTSQRILLLQALEKAAATADALAATLFVESPASHAAMMRRIHQLAAP